ncbi:Leucine-rich repeat receptor protein kinase hpca1 [Ancistrocladus abbreviatus]
MYYRSLEASLMNTSQLLSLPVDSVALSHPVEAPDGYLTILLDIFPAGQVSFNRTGISILGFMLSNLTFQEEFGPFYLISGSYKNFAAEPARPENSSHIAIAVAAAVGGSVLVLLALSGLYAYHQKWRAGRAVQSTHYFASSWDKNSEIPQLKGARRFSFEEIRKYTNNFAEVNNIGSGGYGKVYKGVLANGQLVAIKRARAGSMQGSMEFRTEIELLSRVHHKNLVNLLGFCFYQDEQILVYEYLPNGTLLDSLSGKSGIRLDWMRRLRVALGSARGLAYLHELADPPIIHRDIKSNNILLDEHLNAKVADLGLSKPFSDREKGYLTTQVKGTMGYLDPEYYMTLQLTEKSDVYSFGVLMLELVTGRRPLQQGRNYIVKDVRIAIDKRKDLYGLHALIDPAIASYAITLVGFEKFVDLAMRCVEETSAGRPTMGEVVKWIEQIIRLAGLNPNVDSAPTSTSCEGSSAGNIHQIYGDDALCLYSGHITSPR